MYMHGHRQGSTEMQHTTRWIAGFLVLIIAGLGLSACTRASADPVTTSEEAPSHVEAIEGSDLHRVTLSEKAAERVGIETTAVREEQVNGTARRVIPHGAVLYDANGVAWAYTNPEPLVFVRHQLAVERIDGDTVILADGPATDTLVVTVGAVELAGAENGVGH
jgi:hypothetical protein